ncbi:DUF2905 domain-containing protein [Mechercharimyces sp. CAU 1602]|uniref:DUF2905 domain-containing protein n=1 Tax=Mechercharimyces sp. CAU 1602 TaxID=2973933 RepID=UPI0021622ADF|nr:DUF2905 domain-containing protein [Mechercharimyces sp. CAU 1602]MCS1351409.1 DUF2905 domain-containing protein [Mechercharimyces sp. CAU 1602]
MNPMAKLLVIAGVILIVVGVMWQVGGRWLGRLPGDILIERENMKIYFPLVTSLLISVVISLLFYVINLFR